MNSAHEPKEGFVESENVSLQYLDWGGSGQILVLMPGLGDTPIIFDSLAKALSDRAHVISYSRRSHGKSKAADSRFDNATLVSDLKLLLDSLEIDKANLLGWSMAGNEITEFAALYPDRVSRLIYFESGYDLSDSGFAKLLAAMPKAYLPDSTTKQSIEHYRNWYHHFWFGDMEWNEVLEANLQASIQIRQDGSIQIIPNDPDFNNTLKEAMAYRRRYGDVDAPSLVIFAAPFFSIEDKDPDVRRTYDSIEKSIVSPWRNANRTRIGQELVNSVVIDVPNGSHTSFLFLSHDKIVKAISEFLANDDSMRK